MTSFLEFEEKNVDLAVDKACKELNLTKEELDYDVLSYGSTGIFGLVGSKKAKIRVKLPERNVHASELKRDSEELKSETKADSIVADKALETAKEQDISEEWVGVCRQTLERIVETITEDATISVETGPDCINFDIRSGNAAVLIGKRGQTLEAIQYIIEKIANKGNNRRMRVQVDVQGYLKTRQENLERLALRLAEKAVRTGKPVTIGQMNAHDRRIVHLALKNDGSVRTKSLGEGAYRKLMIYPKRRGTTRGVSH
ncbi:MAG: Jag N-terminal domain-containing protein [Deltaproteobacteria bacterium]|nr:Jag N-terminal domain-containing protein [Deltaproteobacteria bacterium]MBW1995432.1 Jag N-terminal domain-containing protein [Deltaproteobacteria bacterium]MBW2153035.1 Jag N-terminal domain-containing protein [Deltaproteobacteria bacterium]